MTQINVSLWAADKYKNLEEFNIKLFKIIYRAINTITEDYFVSHKSKSNGAVHVLALKHLYMIQRTQPVTEEGD